MNFRSFKQILLVLSCIVALLLAVFLIAGPFNTTPHKSTIQLGATVNTIPNSPFVTSYGGMLYLNGAPYNFHGLNIFNAANISNCWYPLARGAGLNATLTAIGSGQNAFRTWF